MLFHTCVISNKMHDLLTWLVETLEIWKMGIETQSFKERLNQFLRRLQLPEPFELGILIQPGG